MRNTPLPLAPLDSLLCLLLPPSTLRLAQDGIIERPEDGDIGAVFGCGFLPYTGGPFRMLDERGTQQYVDMMMRHAEAYGEQFVPCQLLQDMGKNGGKFYK